MNNATWISWFYFKYAIMIYNYNIYVNHHINRSNKKNIILYIFRKNLIKHYTKVDFLK